MDSSVSHTHFIRGRGWWLAPVLIVLAIAIAWMARAAILRDVAELWVVSDSLDRADAIVVLGGRIDVRPFAAAELYRRGFAPRVLISHLPRDLLQTMQLWPGQTELTRQLLLKLGVAAEDIVEFGDGKHVPLLEQEWKEAVKTNVFGSVNVVGRDHYHGGRASGDGSIG